MTLSLLYSAACTPLPLCKSIRLAYAIVKRRQKVEDAYWFSGEAEGDTRSLGIDMEFLIDTIELGRAVHKLRLSKLQSCNRRTRR